MVFYVDYGLALSIESFFNSFYWNIEKFYEASLFYFSGGVLISIKCSAWAKNIKHDSKGESGAVHFELMID